MKTRKVELKGWANVLENNDVAFGTNEKIVKESWGARKAKYKAVPCTVTFEIPEPEHTVTISETEFSELWTQEMPSATDKYFEKMKKLLFGKKQEGGGG